MNYTEVIDELRADNIAARGGEFFMYADTPSERLFELFWDNGQKFLNNKRWEQYFLNPRLYYNTNTSENACAYVDGKYSLIVIFMGAVVPIYQYYEVRKGGFKTDAFKDYNEVSQRFDITPDIYLFQAVTLFFLYHEAGHLIQLNNQPRQYTEFINCANEEEERHAKEFDADWFASNELAFHIVDLWRSLEFGSDIEAIEFLHKMAELALAGVYVYLIKASKGYPKLYYQELCHPHPSVRLAYIIHYFVDTIRLHSGLGIKQESILRNAVAISSELMSNEEPNPVEFFSLAVMYQNLDDIEKYIQKIINDCRTKYPECCINRLADKEQEAEENL